MPLSAMWPFVPCSLPVGPNSVRVGTSDSVYVSNDMIAPRFPREYYAYMKWGEARL